MSRGIYAMVGFAQPTILALLLLSQALLFCHSFQQSPLLNTRSTLSPSVTSNRRYSNSAHTTHFYADPTSANIHDQTPPPPSFEQRMRQQLKQQTPPKPTNIKATTNKLVPDIRNLEGYKEVLDKASGDEKMLAVLWYSPWCKACRAVIPGIRTLAKRHPDIQFIQVPVIAENANLHQGLDVPSVPFMHLYVPDDPRLVEESKMTRKRLSAFQKLLRDYERGSCSLENNFGGEESVWSTSCPYSFPSINNRSNVARSRVTP